MATAGSILAADWNRGVAYYNKSEYGRALVEFQDIVREHPDVAGAWYYIGLCQFKLNRYKQVQSPMSRAIDLLEAQSPGSADIDGAWYTIGFSYFALGDYEKAIEPIKRYVERASAARRPIDQAAQRALGRSYFYLERYDDALPLLSATRQSSNTPSDPNGDGAQAKDKSQDAFYVGAIYYRRGDDDHAIEALERALGFAPGDPAVLDMLASSLIRKATASSSKAYWLRAAEVGEKLQQVRDDLKSAEVLGRAYLGAGNFEKAVAPLEKIAKSRTDDGQAWMYYGIALSRSGMSRKAMEALEMSVQLAPDLVPALNELGYVYESDKQYQQALRAYEKAFAASGSTNAALRQSIDRVRALASEH
ncbi:MAG TPA: tetratricopeptide repeat protein [Blastocatellia bacterium]|nr:tetratricopeptide repeat protein [Blastocatellia bacterium]